MAQLEIHLYLRGRIESDRLTKRICLALPQFSSPWINYYCLGGRTAFQPVFLIPNPFEYVHLSFKVSYRSKKHCYANIFFVSSINRFLSIFYYAGKFMLCFFFIPINPFDKLVP